MLPAKPLPTQSLPKQVREAIAKVSVETRATAKQLKMAELLATGYSKTEAYRRAYETEHPKPWVNASLAAKNEKVTLMLEAGRISQSNLTASRGQQWREKIDEKLWEIADSKTVAERDRIAALKLAGSQVHVQAFSKAVDADAVSTGDRLNDALAELTSELATVGFIDIEAVPVAQSLETMQAVDCIRLRHLYELDECAGGGCD